MSRLECMDGINGMLEKVSTENLERLYYFISGCAMVSVLLDEKESGDHE